MAEKPDPDPGYPPPGENIGADGPAEPAPATPPSPDGTRITAWQLDATLRDADGHVWGWRASSGSTEGTGVTVDGMDANVAGAELWIATGGLLWVQRLVSGWATARVVDGAVTVTPRDRGPAAGAPPPGPADPPKPIPAPPAPPSTAEERLMWIDAATSALRGGLADAPGLADKVVAGYKARYVA